MRSCGAEVPIQGQRLHREEGLRNRYSHSVDLLPEADYEFNEMTSNRIAARPVERQGMLGRVQRSNRRWTAVYACLTTAHELADELRIAAEDRKRYAKPLSQRTANHDSGGVNIVQAKRAAATSTIRIRLIRSLAKNAERLSVIQHHVSVIRNDTAEKLFQRRSETAIGTESVGEDDGA